MCHGSPWDPNYYIYPDAKKEVLDRNNSIEVEAIFMGHTHYQFFYSNKQNLMVNVGSVGQSRYRGGYADWSILNKMNGVIKLISTPYDTSELLKEVENNDSENSYLTSILKRTR